MKKLSTQVLLNAPSGFNSLKNILFKTSFFGVLFLLFAINVVKSQNQTIGTFPGMEGGFEVGTPAQQAATTVTAGTQLPNWTGANVANSIPSISTTLVRTGGKALAWQAGSTSGVLFSPTAPSTAITNATTYIVQFYWWKNYGTGSARAFGTQISPEGTTSLGTSVSSGTLGTNGVASTGWTKAAYAVTSGSSAVGTRYGLLQFKPSGGGFTAPGYNIDDYVIYVGATPDVTAPNVPTSGAGVTVTSGTQLTVAWGAASGGVDGGGYMVVRGTSDPTTTPNANGIYGVGNTVAAGQTVAYIGTGTSFVDGGLTSGVTYYYRIYTVDKAFNYSTALTGLSGTPNAGTPSPTLTAAVGATVDAPFTVTYPSDDTWRDLITAVKVGGVTLTGGYNIATSGQIIFTPSASAPTASLLQQSGNKSITVEATGYSTASVSQQIDPGVATKLALGTLLAGPTTNGGTFATQPTVIIQDQYNNTTTSTANVTANAVAGTSAWTVGGTNPKAGVAGVATFTDLTATSALGLTGATIQFTSSGLTPVSSAAFNIPGPIAIAAFATAYTQDFNTLPNTGSNAMSTLPLGWTFSEAGSGPDVLYGADNGGSGTGNTYSYGTTASSERAFGGLQSGTQIPTVGVQYRNTTGSTITELAVAYTGEQWRVGALTRNDQLDFQYSTDATSLTTGTWTDVNSLDFVAPIQTPVGALDGNSGANRTAKSASITSLSIPNNTTFWFRWNDFGASGADDGLAVDDYSITAIQPIVPPTVTTTTVTGITTGDADGGGEVTDEGTSAVTARGIKYGTTSPASDVTTTDGAGLGVFTSDLTPLDPNTKYYYRAYATSYTTVHGSELDFTTLPNPPTIEAGNNTSAQSSVGATTFTAYWTAPAIAGTATYEYSIEVNDDNTFTDAAEYTESGISSGNTSVLVGSLSPGNTYYYRVKTTNVSGAQSSVWSNTSDAVNTTSSTVPVVTVTDAITVYTDVTADGGGTVFSDGGEALDDRGLVYNTSSPAEDGGTIVSETGNALGAFTQQLTGLTPNTLYYVQAYGHNAIGYGYGPEQSFTTLSTEPTTNGTLTFSDITNADMTVDFSGGDGTKRIVIALAGSAPTFTPADITNYNGANNDYASAPTLGTGKLVYNDDGSSFTLSGLAANTTYHFIIYEYSVNDNGDANYFTTALSGSQLTTPNAPVATAGTNLTGTSFSANWNTVAGATTYHLDVATDIGFTSFVTDYNDVDVTNVLTYPVNTNLTASTTYYYRVRAYNAAGASASSNIITTSTISAEPTVQTSNVTFSAVTFNGFTVNFDAGDGSDRIVLIKANSAVSADPADGSTYTDGSNVYASGSLIPTGNYVVYKGSGSSVVVTGLAPGTTYHVAVYEFNGSGGTENYLTAAPATGSQATASTDYQTIDGFASGNWNGASTWESWDGASWVATATPPDASSGTITVRSGVVTVTASTNADQLTINSGAQVTVAASQTLTIADGTGVDITVIGYLKSTGTVTNNGQMTVGNGVAVSPQATYEHNVNGGAIPAATWTTGSTCLVTGVTSTMPSGFSQTFYTLTYNNPSQSGSLNMGMYNTTINGDFNYLNGGSAALETGLTNSNAGAGPTNTITIVGNFNVNSSINTNQITGHRSGSAGTVTALTVNIGGNLNITSGAFFLVRNAGIATTWNLAGNFNMTGGSFSSSNVNSNFHFAKVGTQTYTKTAGTLSSAIVIIDATSTVDAGTSAFDGNIPLTIINGATLISANASGSITTTGTKTFGATVNYVFNGAVAQTTNASITGANNITLNNSAGLILGGPIAVTGTLTLTSGKVTLGAHTLTLTNAISGASSTNYIVTTGAGLLKRLAAGISGATLFPVGNSTTSYTPLTITNTGTSQDLSVGSSATITNAVTDPTKIVTLQWTVTSGGAGAVGTIVYNWNDANQAGSFTEGVNGELGVYSGSGPYTLYSLGVLPDNTVTKSGISLASGSNLMVIGNTSAIYATILGYDVSTTPGGTDNFGTSPFAATVANAGITGGGLTRGAGVGTTGASGVAGGWGGIGWNNATAAANITANKFITFTVKPNSGNSTSLLSINPFDYRRSSTGPPSGLIQYSINGNTYVDIATVNFSSTSTSGSQIGSTDLSGISALQNLQSNQTVTFRIVPYNASGSTGTFYIYNFGASTAPDLALNGTVNACASTTATPVITSALCSGQTSVSGTSSEADGTTIELYVNGTFTVPPSTATVSGGTWTATTAALTAGQTVTAYALASGKCVSAVSSGVTVGSASTAAVLSGATTISCGGTANLAVAITGGTSPFSVVYSDGTSNFTVNGYTSGSNIPVSPATTTTYNLVSVTGTGGCAGTGLSGTPTVTVNSTNTFTGAEDDNYSNEDNWSCGVVPSPSGAIVINAGSGRVVIDQDLDITGSLNYNGSNAGDTLIIAPGVQLKATGGSIHFHDNPVLIMSRATGTGSIGQVTSLAGATNVTTERYIRQNTYRGWRLLSLAVAEGSQTIRQSWQEGATSYVANPNPGYGTRITANTATAVTDGFDAQTFGNSLLQYDGVNWQGFTSSLLASEVSRGTAADAWMIYIRGDRTVDTAQAITTPSETVLRAKGPLYTAPYPTVTIPANTNGLVGNILPSEIDFLNVNRGGGADDAFYVWDPQLYGSYGLGAYQTFSASTPIPWKPVPGGGSYGTTPNTKIQSGMGFFVHATGSQGSIQLTETSKSAGKNVGGTGFRPASPAAVVPYIETNLYAAVTGGNYSLADGNIVGFDDSYNNDIDNKDNVKVQGFGDGIGMVRGTTVLSAEQRKRIVSGDIIPYRMTNLKKQAYKLEIIPSSLNDGLTTAVLEDKYLNTATPISLDAPTTRVFNADPAVQASFYERFRVVFSRPTPVTIINVSAEQKAQGMEIGWKTGVENGVKQYEVERSADGNNFTKAGTLPATANNGSSVTYSFMDVAPLAGVNYYRIKTVDQSGAIRYSYVIKVVNGNGTTPAITLNTTVITDNRISLQFTNQPKGKYGIRLSNAIGQQLMQESVQHNGGNSTQSFTVPALVSKGIYHLEIVKPNGSKQVEKVVVN